MTIEERRRYKARWMANKRKKDREYYLRELAARNLRKQQLRVAQAKWRAAHKEQLRGHSREGMARNRMLKRLWTILQMDEWRVAA